MAGYKDYLASPYHKIPKRSRTRYRNDMGNSDIDNVEMYNVDEVHNMLNKDATASLMFRDENETQDNFGDVNFLLEDILMDDLYSEENLIEEDDICFEPLNAGGDEPLFPGSRMKVQELVLILLTLSSSCHISGSTLKLIMRVIEMVCPKENKCKTSMKGIYAFLQSLQLPLRKHFYCEKCYLPKDQSKHTDICTCGERKSSYFIDIPMLGELKKILERLWEHTRYRFQRNNNTSTFSDVYDGEVYQKHFRDPDGFLRNMNNISLVGFVDGVSIFKSSGFSVWPVYLTINELPPSLRFRRENGIFAGLWFGKAKPQFSTFFKPFAETLWDLYENGLEIQDGSKMITVRALLLQMTCDAPAKCLFQNFKQFNGKYGCPYCLHPGESVLHSEKSRSYIYDYRNEDDCTRRSHVATLQHANEAFQNKVDGKSKFDVLGVKGLSWPMFLPKFDVIESVCIDYMHSVLLGVVKQIMLLWFGGQHKGKAWSCFSKIDTVQERLLSIKPTNSITRVPRSIQEMNHWKASEFRAWILFYGHVCMFEILPDEYFQHYLLLAESVWLLLQTSISVSDIDQAHRNLQYFCYQLEHLYDKRALTFNCHQLLHLAKNVKNHGPLWTHSCFYFEDCNGQLRQFFHGTQNVENQVLRTVSVIQSLPELVKKLEVDSDIENLYSAVKGIRPRMRCIEEINGYTAVGMQTTLTPEEIPIYLRQQIEELYPHYEGNVHAFCRMVVNNQMIHSCAYLRVEQRNSYTIEFKKNLQDLDSEYGQIMSFYKLSGCLCPPTVLQCYCQKPAEFFALIIPLPVMRLSFVQDDLTGLTMKHSRFVKRGKEEDIQLMPVSCILGKVLYADFDSSKDFAAITKFPNLIEKD